MKKEYALDDLLGSPLKVNIIKFFVRNNEGKYALAEIARFFRERSSKVRSTLDALRLMNFLLAKKRGQQTVYSVNKSFPLLKELQALVLKAHPASFAFMKRALGRIKGVKLAVASGVFLGSDSSRADLLIVGDRLSKMKISRLAERLESAIGQEIVLAVFDSQEFHYRLNMYDKFIRDILDYRHEKLINKIRLD